MRKKRATEYTVFFAHQTRQRIRIASAACIAYALLISLVTLLLPREGKSLLQSFGWWLVAIPIGLATYVALELFGTWLLGFAFWQRIPSWARILLLVLLISFGTIAAILVGQYITGDGAH